MIEDLITDEFWNRLIEFIQTPEPEDDKCLVSQVKN